MKIIVIRSLRVALVLAILSASINLMVFVSPWFILLIGLSLFFLDAADSMLVWRLKRISVSQMKKSLIYVYLVITVITACICSYLVLYNREPIIKIPYILACIMYSGLITIFSFRYFVIVVRIMARYMD